MTAYTLPFESIDLKSLPQVGGKNASLGEMLQTLGEKGIKVPNGFAVTADAYRFFLEKNSLTKDLTNLLASLDTEDLSNLHEVGEECRTLLRDASLPPELREAILSAYERLGGMAVAVRSSATAEDLPTASFAGQHDSFLNILGDDALLKATHNCYVSLFNDRAIKYRIDNGFDHMDVALSVGVQRMVRSDKASAGVIFTLDPETGFQDCIYLTGAWGLGENVVQGAVNPDEYYFFKRSIDKQKTSLIYRRMGEKENTMVYNPDPAADRPIMNITTPPHLREQWILTAEEAEELARWSYTIEKHYQMPMDIEWAKDGLTGELFITQARPETVHNQQKAVSLKEYTLHAPGKPLCTGKAVGSAIVSGRVCIVDSLADAAKVQVGDVIVAEITNPDWNALLRKAVSIVTNKGGRTSHASIVARELGIIAVVGTMDATRVLQDGQIITVSCAEGDAGHVYEGELDWEEKEIPLYIGEETKTAPMYILADPDRAMALSFYPNRGVGLMRMEFVINNSIQVHPMALVKYNELPDSKDKQMIAALTRHFHDKKEYFITKLSEAIAMVAAAFYPKDVIVRMSDFKTNEYAQLVGGAYFEPEEENPMLGFRGASRYYNERYREAFGLECLAIRRIRETMGLTNVKVMIPFCRTVEEGRKVLDVMKNYGLERGKEGLEVYVMAEIPSNVILADQFAEIFDGFSIGSNDLT
ncbi:MAG: phosphoenolpyruvate synthase, partial [Bacteroidetes bacterium]|nr:phosphoenolpyruvate synthase [Bacteroidota bacterium]